MSNPLYFPYFSTRNGINALASTSTAHESGNFFDNSYLIFDLNYKFGKSVAQITYIKGTRI